MTNENDQQRRFRLSEISIATRCRGILRSRSCGLTIESYRSFFSAKVYLRHVLAMMLLLATNAVVCLAQTQGAYFEVEVLNGDPSERVRIQLLDSALIQKARDIASGHETEAVALMGTVVKAPAFYNSPWSYHIDPASTGFFAFATEVCDATASYVEQHLTETGGAFLPGSFWCPWQSRVLREVSAPSGADRALRVVSAASFQEAFFSPGALITVYGQNITDRSEQASLPAMSTTLAGVSLEVQKQGATDWHKLPLLFASPSHMNALLPKDIGTGFLSMRVLSTLR